MAFPISKEPREKGRYKVLNDPGFKAAIYIFEGSPKDAVAIWIQLENSVNQKGLKLTGERRLVVLNGEELAKDAKLNVDLKEKNRENVRINSVKKTLELIKNFI